LPTLGTAVDSGTATADAACPPQGEDAMRTGNEVTVVRADLLDAVTAGAGTPPRDLRRSVVTLLHWRGGRLVIESPTLTAEIEAAGRWETPVAVDADVLRRLVTKLPDGPDGHADLLRRQAPRRVNERTSEQRGPGGARVAG